MNERTYIQDPRRALPQEVEHFARVLSETGYVDMDGKRESVVGTIEVETTTKKITRVTKQARVNVHIAGGDTLVWVFDLPEEVSEETIDE